MASAKFKVSLLFKNLFDNSRVFILGGLRYKSQKIARPGKKPNFHGAWIPHGSTVTAGTILARQHRLMFCAGLNVGYSRGYLYAKVSGKVLVSTDFTNFNPELKNVQRLSPDNAVLSKTYYHVLPEPQHNRFKLIERN